MRQLLPGPVGVDGDAGEQAAGAVSKGGVRRCAAVEPAAGGRVGHGEDVEHGHYSNSLPFGERVKTRCYAAP